MKKVILLSVIFFILTACSAVSGTANKQKDSKGNLNLAKEKFGIEIASLDEESKQKSGLSHGVLILNVYSFYPANKAGIERGDIIISLNDQTIFNLDGFNQLLQAYKYTYGQVTLGISRDNKIQKIKVHLD